MFYKVLIEKTCLNEKDAKRRESYLKTTQGQNQRLLKRKLKEYFYGNKK